jgi:hypothetical protein
LVLRLLSGKRRSPAGSGVACLGSTIPTERPCSAIRQSVACQKWRCDEKCGFANFEIAQHDHKRIVASLGKVPAGRRIGCRCSRANGDRNRTESCSRTPVTDLIPHGAQWLRPHDRLGRGPAHGTSLHAVVWAKAPGRDCRDANLRDRISTSMLHANRCEGQFRTCGWEDKKPRKALCSKGRAGMPNSGCHLRRADTYQASVLTGSFQLPIGRTAPRNRRIAFLTHGPYLLSVSRRGNHCRKANFLRTSFRGRTYGCRPQFFQPKGILGFL